MDDLEDAFAVAKVEYVGPFGYHDVVLNGRRLPHLEAIPIAGGRVHLSVDRRFGLDLTVAEAERVVPFVAHCLAIGLGYVGFPDEGQDLVPIQHMPRVHHVSPTPDTPTGSET